MREASYNAYRASTWFALHPGFKRVALARDRKTWQLNPPGSNEDVMIVSQALRRGKGMLTLPMGTSEVTDLPVMKMFKNQFGAVKVEEGPGLVRYRLQFNTARSWDSAPDALDLRVPDKDKATLEQIVQKLGLRSLPPRRALNALNGFFQKHFIYSLATGGGKDSQTPLQRFLLKTRSGHCEYFATATVLLLRAAGIPARYATGYSLKEYSSMEGCFVVRERHAHAWTLAYVNGAWQDFDTTPPSWFRIEQATSSTLEPLYNLLSWAMFQYSEWRWSEREGAWTRYLGWLLIPLILVLVRRLYRRRRVRQSRGQGTRESASPRQAGMDSDFYLIEKKLMAQGHERRPWEPLGTWLRRIEEETSGDFSSRPLMGIMALHYRYRFDPNGITGEERDRLQLMVRNWLDDIGPSDPMHS